MKTTTSGKSKSTTGEASPIPVLSADVSLDALRSRPGLLSRVWGWLRARQEAHSRGSRLRVAETVSLGEKRFVAVVQVDGRHFLLAGGPTNIVLLAQLDAKGSFGDVLKKTLTVPAKGAAKPKRRSNVAAQARVNRANSLGDPPRKATKARGRQTHLNGTEAVSNGVQKTVAASSYPRAQAGKHDSEAPTEHMGYFA
jgi:flagellar biogenesis protein FliO